MYCVTYALFFVTLHFFVDSAIDMSTLRLVHSVFRHGDRTPSSTFKTDAGNNETTWKNGFGELTEIGIQQQFQLGQFIKRRYQGFLSSEYNAAEIRVHSSGYNRTIMSALANLAGMYQPTNDQVWNKNISWQPIPVHSRPREMDPMLWMDKPCKAVSDLLKNRVTQSEAYLSVSRENGEFLEFLLQKSGLKELPLMDIWSIYDPIYCETVHNDTHTRPEWVDDKVYNKLVNLYVQSVGFYYNIPEVQRFRGSLLFHDIASRIMEKISLGSTYIQRLKYFAYSAHDTTQTALLENLKAHDHSIPVYDQILFFELHQRNDTYFIELYKRNDTTSDKVLNIIVPECGNPCKAEAFFKLSEKNKPDDWEQECAGISPPTPASSSENINTIIGVLTAACLLFFVLFMVTLFLFIKQGRGTLGLINE